LLLSLDITLLHIVKNNIKYHVRLIYIGIKRNRLSYLKARRQRIFVIDNLFILGMRDFQFDLRE